MQLDTPPDAPAERPPSAAPAPGCPAAGNWQAAADISPGNALASTLEQVIAGLDHLNRHTEQDFLKIGGKLFEFIEAVNLISSELNDLANLEHALHAPRALAGALDSAREMMRRTGESSGLLGSIRQEAYRLKRTLAGFDETVSTFRTLGVLTRIETTRLGGASTDFGNLAGDVKDLAGKVKARVESGLAAAALLIPPIENALRSVGALEEGQAKDLPSLISGVERNLAAFGGIQKQALDSSVRLAARYAVISDAFKKLIVSIQFHDLTRQQVEHVIEALRRLSAESVEENGISRSRCDPAAVLPLQSMQLADAGAKFAASAASLVQTMDDIAAHVLEMAGESRTLSGLSEEDGKSFFLQMERGCAAILASLSHCAAAEAATRATSGALAATIARMRGPVAEIRTIELQVHFMALNARISADQLGASGNVLAVLAASMQQLASDCRKRSASLVEVLDSVNETATRLCGQGESAPAGENGNRDGVLEGMRAAVAELHSSSQHSAGQAARTTASGARLHEDLCALRQSFSVGPVFAEAVSQARGMLQELGGKYPSAPPPDGAGWLDRDLADFATHYTMQAERDVHEGVAKAMAGASNAAAPAPPSAFPSAEAAELGENVEFF